MAIPRGWLYLAGALVVGLLLTRVRVRPLSVLGVVLVVGALLYGGKRLLDGRPGGPRQRAPRTVDSPALPPAPPGPGPALDAAPSRAWLQEHGRRVTRVAAGCLGLALLLVAGAVLAFVLTDRDGRPGLTAVLLAVLAATTLAAAVTAVLGRVQTGRVRRALRRAPWEQVSAQLPLRAKRWRPGRSRATTVRDIGPVRLVAAGRDPVVVSVRDFAFAATDPASLPVGSDGRGATAWYVGDDRGNGVLAPPGGGPLVRTRATTG